MQGSRQEFKAFQEKYAPDYKRTRLYQVLAIADGRKTAEGCARKSARESAGNALEKCPGQGQCPGQSSGRRGAERQGGAQERRGKGTGMQSPPRSRSPPRSPPVRLSRPSRAGQRCVSRTAD